MIKKIKISNGTIHNNFEINFSKGGIASIVGQNGHGKSQALNSILNGHQSFINNKITNREISFSVNKKNEKEFELFSIFKSEFFDFKFRDIFNDDDWEQSIIKLDEAIVRKIKDALSLTDNIHKTETLKDFENMIASYGVRYIWDYFRSMYDNNNKQYLLALLEDKEELWKTLDEMSQWFRKMENVIKYKNIIPNERNFSNSYIQFKEDGNYDVRYSLENNSTWFIKIISFLNLSDELKKFGREISEKEDNADEVDKFNKKMKQGFANMMNQPNLDIILSLSPATPEDNLTFYIEIGFMENDNPIDYDNLSLGTKNFINILFQLGNTDENTIVTIDEPDMGLHPWYQILLREELEKVAEETSCKFVICTHSIYMLNSLNNRVNTYVSWKDEKGIFHLDNITNFHNLKDNFEGTQIWEFLGYNFFQEDININKNDKILLVEGDSDKIYIKSFFKLNPESDSIKNLKIISMTGADKAKYWATYLNEAKDIEKSNIFILLDQNVNKATSSFLSDAKFKFAKIKFDNIEDIFEGNDKLKFTKRNNTNNKYIKKLLHSMKFSINKSELQEKTKENILNIKREIMKLIKQ